jgi:hypothetical protein
MRNYLKPVGPDQSQIGRIEDLMATPTREVRKVGERAVAIDPWGKIEADWIIERFNPETGAATVSRADTRGRIIRREIPRDEYLNMNFPRSDEMFYTLEDERKKIPNEAVSSGSPRRVIEKEQEYLLGVINAFAKGDMKTVREHFISRAKKLKKRYKEDEVQRERALEEMEKIEKLLVKLEQHRLYSRGSDRDADELAIIHAKEDLRGAKMRFEDANRRLGAGHFDLERLLEFISTLDQEIEKRGRREAA